MSKIIDTRYQKIRRNKEELIEHLNTFKLDIKTSVGIWYFTPVGGRFHESYVPFKDMPEKIEMAAEMAKYGVKAIKAHYPTEANEENYYLYEQLEKERGIKLLSCYPAIFFQKEYEFSSLSNPYKKYRDKAIEISIRAMTIMYNNKILELKDEITDFIESEREDVTEIYKLIFKI